MAVEMAIWRMTDEGLHRLESSPLDFEQRLEDMLAEDPAMIDTDLLVIGRQVRTGFGGVIDLLALDAEGRVHVLELKRDKTPRDVVAQALDYGSWAKDLSLEQLEQIHQDSENVETRLDEAFAEHFGGPLPDVVNAEQQFTIVASELDPTSDRIIEFLAGSYDVPINAVFFRHFADGGHEYLARTWLLDPHQVEDKGARLSRRKLRPWNGRDVCVILGHDKPDDPRWHIARKHGYLSAGGRKRLRNLEEGQRVFAYVSGAGYVGIGQITGEMIPARDAQVDVDGQRQPLLDQPDINSARWRQNAASEDPEVIEMVVAVKWLATQPVGEAFLEKNLFTPRQTLCKLRHTPTIETVESAFGLNEVTK
ncbi:MAG: endonuclease NucS [bacterium]|nr:endonuclease NucS [bacterium]